MKKFNTAEEQKAFDLGVAYAKKYIAFCIANYVFKFNLGGVTRFFNHVCDFVRGVNHIPNNDNNISFKKFCEKYDVEE